MHKGLDDKLTVGSRLQNKVLYQTLAEADPDVAKIIEDETWRQFSGLELIASEVCFI